MIIVVEKAIRQRHCAKCKEVIEKDTKCLKVRIPYFPYTSVSVCKSCVKVIVAKLGRSKIDLSGKEKRSAITEA